MNIKNKIVNTKDYKKSLRLNKKMKAKLKKYANKDITKCTLQEQCLFGPISPKDNTTKNDKNKFLQFNRKITLLYLFPKSDAKNLCNNFKKMFLENSSAKDFFPTTIDDRFNDFFKSYDNHHNSHSYGSIGHIAPKTISNYVNYINIVMFNFSSNYLGTAFECILTEKILSEINNLITCDIDDNIEYKEYYIGSKKNIGRWEINPDIIRHRILNNTILEIKCIINDFINHYLKFEKRLQLAPISLNLYETNYKISDRVPEIMRSHDIYEYTNRHKLEKFIVWEHFKNKSDIFFEADVCFGSYSSYGFLDRSSNLFIYTEKNDRNLFLIPEDIVDIYISILHFYKNIEFEKIISEERNAVFSLYSNTDKKGIYKAYAKFISSVLKYKTLLNNVVSYENVHIERLKRVYRYQNKLSDELINDCKEFEKYFEHKLSIDNINETRAISNKSLIVAILSLAIAIVPLIYNYTYNKNKTNDIDKINSSIKEINTKIQENNNYLNKIIKQTENNTLQN